MPGQPVLTSSAQASLNYDLILPWLLMTFIVFTYYQQIGLTGYLRAEASLLTI